MQFDPPLRPGRLIRRYKRFLADVELDGEEITAHVANPGAMTGLAEPGARIWLAKAPPGRKLGWSWKLTEVEGGFACVDTGAANRVVEEALRAGRIAALSGYDEVKREAAIDGGSRIDFLLTKPERPPAYIEVKSVTLRLGALAAFPDTRTTRGAKHLGALENLAKGGARAVMLYLVQRTDLTAMRLAEEIDPDYAKAHASARAAGVETLVMRSEISPAGVALGPQARMEEA